METRHRAIAARTKIQRDGIDVCCSITEAVGGKVLVVVAAEAPKGVDLAEYRGVIEKGLREAVKQAGGEAAARN